MSSTPRPVQADVPPVSASVVEPTAAHVMLEGFMESGLRKLFCNLGTDHVSIIEALAAWKRAGRETPEVFLCPHENVAVHMAGGYAAATGEGQAVLVHVDAGTANAAMALHNLHRARIPVLVAAGQAPYTLRGELTGSRDNYVHFMQDPFDIGSLVRPYVKWEYAVQDAVVAKEVVQRAHAVMHSDPPGPVFLTLPRETLARTCAPQAVRSFPATLYGAVQHGGLDEASVQAVAQAIAQAQRPVVVTAYLGRRAQAVAALTELAEQYALPVYEVNPGVLNVPRDSTCFAGFQADAALAEADLVLLLDVDVPWLPKYAGTLEPPHCIQIDLDAIKAGLPMWGFGAHTRLQADTAKALPAIGQALAALRTPALDARVQARAERLAARREAEAARVAAEPMPWSAALACAALQRRLDPEDIVVNEAIRNGPAVLRHLRRTRAHTYFANAGGGLGFSGGFALGLKLACPQARVVQVVGDGSFHFCAPTAVYAVAQQYRLPILTVVLDNGGWQAVKESVLRVHPDGVAAADDEFQARLEGEVRQFEQVGAAFGAHADVAADPVQLEAALDRCLAALDGGQSVVLRLILPAL